VFYDVDEALRPTSLDHFGPTKAIIAVDYFGFPQNLDPFRSYCERTNATLIEDNAHGLFSRDEHGELLGTRADFGILSMRKTFHVASGAALIAKHGSGPPIPCQDRGEGAHGLRYRLSRFERRTGIPAFSGMRTAIRLNRTLLGRPAIDLGSVDDETVLPADVAIGCKSLHRLLQQDIDEEITRRNFLFDAISDELRHVPHVSLIHRQLPSHVVPYGVPFRMEHIGQSVVRHLATQHKVTLMQWPSLPAAIEEQAPDFYRNLWLYNFL
jgi:hypothetical protein